MSQFSPRGPPCWSLNLTSLFLRIFKNTLLSSLVKLRIWINQLLPGKQAADHSINYINVIYSSLFLKAPTWAAEKNE